MQLHVGADRSKYFRSWTEVWVDGMFGGLFTFILFWTVLYGMVHVY